MQDMIAIQIQWLFE